MRMFVRLRIHLIFNRVVLLLKKFTDLNKDTRVTVIHISSNHSAAINTTYRHRTRMRDKENIISPLRLPSDAFNFGDELYNRAKESVEQKSILPLLKDELRCKIQTKRLSQGLDELKVEFEVKPPTPLTDEEKARQISRKHNNRDSAKKCRLKKKETFQMKQLELQELEEKNHQLKQQIHLMEEEKEYYLSNIVSNPVIKAVLQEISNSSANNLTDVVYQQNYSCNQNL